MSMAESAPRPAPEGAPTGRIEVKALNAWFGAHQALHGIDLTFESRRCTSIIGPSGCGKSTLLRSLNRLHEEVPGARLQGAVQLDGDDIYAAGADPVRIRRDVGMVFQRPNPFPNMSVRDNVLAGFKLNGARRADADAIVEKTLRASALWDELKDLLHKPGASLSGGQQQRLCIARALATRPRVLLMDEPCSALDPIATARIEDLMEQLKSTYTIVIVTHNMQQAARVSERAAFFMLGELIEYDLTKQVFTNPSKKETEDYVTGRFG